MDHYQEIVLLPDPEFVPSILMNVLFGKLHHLLVAQPAGSIGVSFPDIEKSTPTLGSRLRIHGSDDDLARLGHTEWLAGMGDHLRVGVIRPVPKKVLHRVVRRVQTKSNPERLRRRLMKRKGISVEEARQAIPDSVSKRSDLPFVMMKSGSSGHGFYLFIEHLAPQETSVAGEFSRYGLSTTATVPWF